MLQRGYDPLHIESAVNTKAYHWLLRNQPINKVPIPDVTTNFKVYTLNWNDHELEMFVGDDKDAFQKRLFFWPKLTGNWTRWYFSFSKKHSLFFLLGHLINHFIFYSILPLVAHGASIFFDKKKKYHLLCFLGRVTILMKVSFHVEWKSIGFVMINSNQYQKFLVKSFSR